MEMRADERLRKLEEHRQSQLRMIKRYKDMPETSVFKRNRAVFKRFMDAQQADLRAIEHTIRMAEAGKGA